MTYFGLMWWGCGGMQTPSSAYWCLGEDLNKSTTLGENFRHKSGNSKCGKRERKKVALRFIKWIKISKTKSLVVKGWSLALHGVYGWQCILPETHLWSRYLGSQSLNQALALPKEKPIVRSYNDLPVYSPVWESCRLIPSICWQN